MSKTLIVTGGSINVAWAKEWLGNQTFDYCIAADSGLEYADKLGLKVDFLLGDYDSVDKDVLDRYKSNTEFEIYPKEKDYTDTHLAIMTALKKGATDIYILGATGTRMDHTITNIGNMKVAADCGKDCHIVDEHNYIYLLSEADGIHIIRKDSQYGRYVSIIPMSENVSLSLEGFKYTLDNYELKQGLSICQSNEVEDEQGIIKVHKGLIIVLETKD